MSAISSVGSSMGSLLMQQLQQPQNDNDQDDQVQSVGNVQGRGPAGWVGGAKFKAALEAAAKAAGIDPAKLPEIQKQIQAAIAKAKQNAGSSADPKTAIRDAVNGVLKDNGIDPAKFESALKAGGAKGHHGKHHHAKPTALSALNAAPAQPLPGQTVGTVLDIAA